MAVFDTTGKGYFQIVEEASQLGVFQRLNPITQGQIFAGSLRAVSDFFRDRSTQKFERTQAEKEAEIRKTEAEAGKIKAISNLTPEQLRAAEQGVLAGSGFNYTPLVVGGLVIAGLALVAYGVVRAVTR